MNVWEAVAAALALALFVYLFAVLLRPEDWS